MTSPVIWSRGRHRGNNASGRLLSAVELLDVGLLSHLTDQFFMGEAHILTIQLPEKFPPQVSSSQLQATDQELKTIRF